STGATSAPIQAPSELAIRSSISAIRTPQGYSPHAPVYWVTSISADSSTAIASEVVVSKRNTPRRISPRGRNSAMFIATCSTGKLVASSSQPAPPRYRPSVSATVWQGSARSTPPTRLRQVTATSWGGATVRPASVIVYTQIIATATSRSGRTMPKRRRCSHIAGPKSTANTPSPPAMPTRVSRSNSFTSEHYDAALDGACRLGPARAAAPARVGPPADPAPAAAAARTFTSTG